jgi:hypothetical protein
VNSINGSFKVWNAATFRQRLLKILIAEAIEELLNSNDPIDRRVGIYTAGALDQPDILAKALRDAKHP